MTPEELAVRYPDGQYTDNDRAAVLAEFWLERLWERPAEEWVHWWYSQHAIELIDYCDLFEFPRLERLIAEQVEKCCPAWRKHENPSILAGADAGELSRSRALQ